MSKKKFTLENLRDDRACKTGLAFVTPLIEAGEDVASALLDNGHDDWFRWALERDYDVDPARRLWRTWDKEGYVYTTSGYYGTSTSGNYGTSTSGRGGTSTSGNYGTSTSGDFGTSTSRRGGTSTSGYRGTSTSGDCGTSTSGRGGTSTSGNYGTSTSRRGGTSTSGDCGTSTSGRGGTVSSGVDGVLILDWHDGARRRVKVGYVGENGLEPDTLYRLNREGEFEEVVDE